MEIVHVCGHSCVGKRSLIQQLVDPGNDAVRRRFKVLGNAAAVGPAPDSGYATTEWHPVSELETIEIDHALHKWQFVTHDCILRIRKSRPNVAARAILLWCEPNEHRERIALKGLWKPVPSIAQLQHDWESKIVPRFAALKKEGIPVEIVDAGNSGYPIKSEPAIDQV